MSVRTGISALCVVVAALSACAIGGEDVRQACTRLSTSFPGIESQNFTEDVRAYVDELEATRTTNLDVNARITDLRRAGQTLVDSPDAETYVEWAKAEDALLEACAQAS